MLAREQKLKHLERVLEALRYIYRMVAVRKLIIVGWAISCEATGTVPILLKHSQYRHLRLGNLYTVHPPQDRRVVVASI